MKPPTMPLAPSIAMVIFFRGTILLPTSGKGAGCLSVDTQAESISAVTIVTSCFWEDNGWRLDVNKIRTDQDEIAYAILSPARRHRKGWVLPAAPLLKGKKPPIKAVG